eukprot:scaffold282422_cov18-Tisochrysis_lutea.AAC.1
MSGCNRQPKGFRVVALAAHQACNGRAPILHKTHNCAWFTPSSVQKQMHGKGGAAARGVLLLLTQQAYAASMLAQAAERFSCSSSLQERGPSLASL